MASAFSAEASRSVLHLHDGRRVIEVSAPLAGVMRIRCSPASLATNPSHPRLPDKQSVAVPARSPVPLTVEQTAHGWLAVGEAASVEIARDTGGFVFHDGDGVVLARCAAGPSTDVRSGYPVPAFDTRVALEAPPGAAYLGFGEKVGPIDKRGMRFTFWNTDVLPHQPDTDPLYVSIPMYIALHEGRASGFFLDETWRSEVDVALANPELVSWQSAGPELDMYLVAGPTPGDVLARYTELTGRTSMPPLWALGFHQSRWGYESAAEIMAVVSAYRAHGLPLDCVHIDIDHLDGFKAWTWDKARFGARSDLVRALANQGVKAVTIVDPALKLETGYEVYEQARERGYLVTQDRGGVLVGKVWPVPAVFPDFANEEVQRWWSGWHRDPLADGVAGFWDDMNEPSCFEVDDPGKELRPPTVPRGLPASHEGATLPYDARHGSKRHIEVHNAYGLGMARASHEACRSFRPDRRPFVLTRAAFAGIQRWAALWTGDNSSYFTHLESSIAMLLGLGASGVAFAGSDVPGFLGSPSPDLLVRWMQLATFYPFARNHSARGTPGKEPWRFGEHALSLARAALERRYRLLPTLYTLMRQACDTGWPIMRPLVFHSPADRDALAAADQFLFGADLLVAPVVRAGQRKRMAYLPEGRWLRLDDLGQAPKQETVHEGPAHVVADAPIDVVPVWLRQGGAVAVTAPAPHTTTANWASLSWHVFIGPTIAGALFEDEGDGDGPHRWSRLDGRFDGTRVRLACTREGTLASERRTERLFLHGLGAAERVEGALGHRVTGDTCEVDVDAGWTEIEVFGRLS